MPFVKDGESKVYKNTSTKDGNNKQASQTERVRYTVDDLVRDTDGPEDILDLEEEDVSDKTRH